MIFVYLDEFGHIGPYVSRSSPKHNESPVFGLAGLILPEQAIRSFATYFLQQKERAFSFELAGSGKMPAKWEKKGTSFIRTAAMQKYPEMRQLINRMINQISARGGSLFYYGREKIKHKLDGNSTGLYTTCLSYALRNIEAYCRDRDQSFIVVLDQHSARKELLECAAKTMFGRDPCRLLASPPFQVESYLNQNMQAADWIATLVGRIAAYEVAPAEYPDFKYLDTLFATRVAAAAEKSQLVRRYPAPSERSISFKPIDPNNPFAALAQLMRRQRP